MCLVCEVCAAGLSGLNAGLDADDGDAVQMIAQCLDCCGRRGIAGDDNEVATL